MEGRLLLLLGLASSSPSSCPSSLSLGGVQYEGVAGEDMELQGQLCRQQAAAGELGCLYRKMKEQYVGFSYCIFFTNGPISPTCCIHGNSTQVDSTSTSTSTSASTAASTSASISEVCQTKGCMEAATQVKENLDLSVSPCDDFYRYSCGNFIERTIIPADRGSETMFHLTSEKVLNQLRSILDEPSNSSQPEIYRMVKTVYEACTDTRALEESGVQPAKQMLKAVGGWPLLGEGGWKEDDFTWYKLTSKLKKMGQNFRTMIDVTVETSPKYSRSRVLALEQPNLGLGREFLVKGYSDPIVQAYRLFMKAAVQLLGGEEPPEQLLNDTVKFNIALANITLSREEQNDPAKQYNSMSVSNLTSLDEATPWQDFISSLMPEGVKVYEWGAVNVHSPDFIRNLSQLIKSTPKKVQASYMLWRVVQSNLINLNKAANEIQLEFSKVITGNSATPARWKLCANLLNRDLALNSLYVKVDGVEKNKVAAKMMGVQIRKQLGLMIDELTWMDETTKVQAKEKYEAMEFSIGSPDELFDWETVSEDYWGLQINEGSFLEIWANVTKWATDKHNRKLREMVKRHDWKNFGYQAIVNAAYLSDKNYVWVPAGILQGPFFSSSQLTAMNFGGLGFVFGHEITHAFDTRGSQFDKQGNLKEWWEPETKARFEAKAQCIIDQFNNFTIKELDGMHVNGELTKGENIADNGGIKMAYRAYNAWVEEQGSEASLPGLPLSPHQLLWVSAAQIWCSKLTREAAYQGALTDVHSPAQFRVRAFANMEDFAKDFHCPQGSEMNPSKRCTFW